LSVNDFPHAADQLAAVVGRKQRVPVAAPDDFDDIPSRSAESPFQFLNDFSVPAHRTVEPLQVAVDDEDQVVELLAGGQVDGAEGFRFIDFAVSHEAPHFDFRSVENAAVFEVAEEPCLIKGHDGAQSHRHRRKLPEVGHQPGMGI
jgi:hypothetical protein